MEKRTDQLISFLKEIEKFNSIERATYTSSNKKETDAEHSWHLAMFLVIFEKELPKGADMVKMLKLALMHDLVEIYCGDTFLFDKEARKGKKERESVAARKLFSKLPEDLNIEFNSLFNEYNEAATKESKIVKSFDKLQAILQNICSNGRAWKKDNITFDDVNSVKRNFMEHDRNILEIYEKLMQEASKSNIFKD